MQPTITASATLATDDGYVLDASADRLGNIYVAIATPHNSVELSEGFSEAHAMDVQDVLDRLASAYHDRAA